MVGRRLGRLLITPGDSSSRTAGDWLQVTISELQAFSSRSRDPQPTLDLSKTLDKGATQ